MIRVTGPDAEKFLQDIITNDMRRLTEGGLLYACLLTPQGQFLHDFFIFKDGDSYVVDTEAARTDDLLRRMNIFKLRAKVEFADTDLKVYSGKGKADPRLPTIGQRHYTAETLNAAPVAVYHDFCIAQGVPCGSIAIRIEKETMSDVNLDLLNAVAWDKGCFIGQEVAARMYNKSIAKRRLFILTGTQLKFGDKLMAGDIEAGEVRHCGHDATTAVAVIKVPSATAKLTCNGTPVEVIVPDYLNMS